MFSLIPLFLASAVQQDHFVQPVSQNPQLGRVTQVVSYGDQFATGWEMDARGSVQAMRYHNGQGLPLGAFVTGGESAGLALDVGGNTVGWAEDVVQGTRIRRPFYYTDQDGLQLIPLPQASEGQAVGISTFGHQAAGTMRRDDGLLQGWTVELFPELGTATPLSTPAGWESEVLAFHQSNGLAAAEAGGLVRDPAGREFAAYWGRNGLQILPTPGTGDARITGIAGFTTGLVCGTFGAAGSEQGFVIDVNDPVNSLMVLPSLGGSWTKPTDMEFGKVYGASADSRGQSRAFRYTLDGQLMEDLNDRASTPNGMVLTQVNSSSFGDLFSYDLEMNGASYGVVSSPVVMGVWPRDAGFPTNVSLFDGPQNRPAAFVYGFVSGQTAVPGSPGLFVDIDQARVVATGQTDSSGNLTQTVQVPPQAAGLTVLMQAVIPSHPITTSVVSVTFE